MYMPVTGYAGRVVLFNICVTLSGLAAHCSPDSMVRIYGHSRFCNTDTEDIVGLHESIRRLNEHYARAPTSSAPDEP